MYVCACVKHRRKSSSSAQLNKPSSEKSFSCDDASRTRRAHQRWLVQLAIRRAAALNHCDAVEEVSDVISFFWMVRCFVVLGLKFSVEAQREPRTERERKDHEKAERPRHCL